MVWIGGGGYSFASSLLVLLHQLQRAYPGSGWINSPQTGTIGDAVHQAKSSGSDHNPWLNNTVRALDVAANVSGVPGILTVHDAPDCEELFAMVNRMYAARDPRVYPDGYAMYLRRITDPARPGQYKPTTAQQDPHLYHLHISVSRNPAGYNSTAPWPLPGESSSSGGASEIGGGDDMPLTEAEWDRLQGMINNALTSQRNWITWAFGNVPKDLSAMKPEIIGQTQRLRDTACAIGGQMAALPDGTKITSIGAAHQLEMAAIAAIPKPLDPGTPSVDLAAVESVAEAGAAKALDGTTVTVTLHSGGTPA
jgi:hypothetical protein